MKSLIELDQHTQLLPLKDDYSFPISNCSVTGWSNCSAKSEECWLCIISLLTPASQVLAPAETDLSAREADLLLKNLKIIEARSLWYPSYFGFVM